MADLIASGILVLLSIALLSGARKLPITDGKEGRPSSSVMMPNLFEGEDRNRVSGWKLGHKKVVANRPIFDTII